MAILDNKDNVLPKGSLILVTGASGYVASNVIVEALDAGYKVRGTARSQAKADKTIELFKSPNYEAVVVEEMEPEGTFDEAVKGVDAIIHTASPLNMSADPKDVVVPAVKGATSILNSALKESSIKRFVFTSSSTAAALAKPGEKFHVDKNTWNTDLDYFADFPPPYIQEEHAFPVYAVSKVKAEQAVWEFVKQHKPSFVVNCILPNFNMGRIIESGGVTGASIVQVYNGHMAPLDLFGPQYMIDVVDDARIHLAAAIDGTVANERIFAYGFPYNWNDVLDVFRELRPGKEFPENRELGRDVSTVDNELGDHLLKKWFGHGYTGLKESVAQNIEGLA